jgi:hypothetical protein
LVRTVLIIRNIGGVRGDESTPPRAFALPPKSHRAGVNPALHCYGYVG